MASEISPAPQGSATQNAFACPLCGSATHVLETRVNPSGIRRRRGCLIDGCRGRLMTQEIAIDSRFPRAARGRWVMVPHAIWEKLLGLARAIVDSAGDAIPSTTGRPADRGVDEISGDDLT